MGLLLRTDLLARDRSAVTRVMEILQWGGERKERREMFVERKNIQSLVWVTASPPHSPPLKSVLEKVKQGLLHHVRHLCGERGPS